MESSKSTPVSSYVVVESRIPDDVRACIPAAFMNPEVSGSVPSPALARVVTDTGCRSVLSLLPDQPASPSSETDYVPDFSVNRPPTTVIKPSFRKQPPQTSR